MNKKTVAGVFWGLLIIAAGVILAGNVMELWDIKLFFRGWWTLLIIIPCLYWIITHGPNICNIAGLIIGVMLLLSNVEFFSKYISWKLIFPVIIIIVGIQTLISAFGKRRGNYSDTCSFREERLNYDGKNFEGGSFKCSFGTLKIDLSGANIDQKIPFCIDCSFGSVEIYLPVGISLDIKSDVNFAEIKNTYPQNSVGLPLSLEVDCSFGSVLVKEKNR